MYNVKLWNTVFIESKKIIYLKFFECVYAVRGTVSGIGVFFCEIVYILALIN